MTAIERDHAVAVFRRLSAIDTMHSIRIFRTIRIVRTEKVHHHHTARLVLVVLAKRICQPEAMYIVGTAKRVIWICDLNRPRGDLLVQIVAKIQRANLNGTIDVMKRRSEAF